ncbi:hypothetical protein PIB30_114517 [Stylosanthes scabra]|uniref:Uncharacterized protein n=1 Tax=Stylosanthes scabra TaxID=79078 RepID=A0ABU6Z0L0_9FABA|nr:hypothetical protein [Stylosanthes scabra]
MLMTRRMRKRQIWRMFSCPEPQQLMRHLGVTEMWGKVQQLLPSPAGHGRPYLERRGSRWTY